MSYFPTPTPGQLLAIDPDSGVPRVHALRLRQAQEGSELLWSLALNSAKGRLHCPGFFTVPSQTAVLFDDYGCFYLLDIENQSTALLHHYQVEYCRAVLLSDGVTLAVLWNHESQYCHYLDLWRWQDGQLARCSRQPVAWHESYDIRFNDVLLAAPDNGLLLHCVRDQRCYLLKFAAASKEETIPLCALDLAPAPEDWWQQRAAFAVDLARGILVMPATPNPDGDLLAEHALEFVDLTNGKRWQLPVRRFSEQVAANYQNERADFINGLVAIQCCQDEPALWLCWSDGVVRKVSLDGQWRSPLYGPSDAKDDQAFGDSELELIQACGFLVLDGYQELAVFSPDPLALTSSQQGQPSAAMDAWHSCPLQRFYWQHNWQLGSAEQYQLERLGSTVIEVSDLSSVVALGFALKRLVLKAESIDELCLANRLRFTFTDGQTDWNEAQFFEQVVALPDGEADMAELLECFIAYPDAECCFHDSYSPALAHCALHLGLANSDWLPLVARYLNSIDPDHEVFFAQEGLYRLYQKHSIAPQWQAFMAALPEQMRQ
ncbi:hypothetical protein [Gallaecimonas mangrovi]|uniref:hypothetical protein n=1 Tax=Gallaecimonas mangrovi TaxID=2291597 RepID=UPI000E208C10|nr:hypothetical protein [Gallaecimonas mangrovi]